MHHPSDSAGRRHRHGREHGHEHGWGRGQHIGGFGFTDPHLHHPGPPQPPFPPEPPSFEPDPEFAAGADFPPFGRGFGFGFGPGFGPGRGHGRGGRGHGRGFGPGRGRARRGNVRAAVLMLLAERPMHGYEMIQEIASRSGGWWRPSPGSVYPTLQLLADEGLITTDQDTASGKRLYRLTENGQAEAGKQDRTPPWEQAADDVDPNDAALRDAAFSLLAATRQVANVAGPDLKSKAAKVLTDARRALYLILADSGAPTEGPGQEPVQDSVPDGE